MKENKEEFEAHIKRQIHFTIEEDEIQNEKEQPPTILMDNKIQVEEPMSNAWTSNSYNFASPLPFERLIIVYQCRKEIIIQMPRRSLRIKTRLARLKINIYTILSSKISHS
jgi:hypothetical protein